MESRIFERRQCARGSRSRPLRRLERGHPESARKSNRPPCKRATLTLG
jgi:hypothetical protein